ncbi:hypothetical protein P154DRAFT_578824 [Amniculicola lignicola CBS 123094]|uniref:Uncharacterized protein n=1 Tax=Amniculicola lignicola CBS 123094 TaxID=1392246 RepID=A0A6A5WEF7_9PLEO|nr:hypothetical protein P154DRAFT_578824 [Amniculicola lignicola CBS 123094]
MADNEQFQQAPGLESKFSIAPIHDCLPTPSGGSQLYKAAGKLSDKKAIITGAT